MELRHYVQARNWPVVGGYLLFIGMMAAGYFYNVTFIQLGLKDLGERVLGLHAAEVAQQMALLALLTCLVALAFGYGMQQRGWGQRLLLKLKLALAVVVVQTILTVVAPLIGSTAGLLTWIAFCSLALGVGVPVTFSLTTDLIPVRDRGYVAAAITAVAYFLAAVFSGNWQIEPLRMRMLLVMVPGVAGLGMLALLATTGRTFVAQWVWELSQNHKQSRFAHGRFLRPDPGNPTQPEGRYWQFVALMFAIFFIDSLGFLRIVDTPILVEGAWRAAGATPRLIIGLFHVIAALVAGILYTNLTQRHLLLWIFGLFTLTHFSYALSVWLLPETTIHGLATPVLYATAVSLYTVINFALWADFATPQNISWKTAVGVALSGWTATFLSTAAAIHWQTNGMPLSEHLRIVESLALVLFLAVLSAAIWPRGHKGKLEAQQ
jgi:hypothetical protein